MFVEPGFELSVDQAYDLQFLMAELREARGERIAGYKIGCISHTMRQQLGLDRPVFGHVWESELRPSGSVLRTADFDGLAIEGEFAIRLAADVPSGRWLRTNPEVCGTGFVIIELHNYVFHGPTAARAAELVANNAIHAGVILPTFETPLCSCGTLRNAALRVTRGREVLGTTATEQLEADPLDAIAQLADHLEQRGRQLHRHDIVLTGSPLPLWRVARGDSIEVWSDKFGTATCSIEPDAEPFV